MADMTQLATLGNLQRVVENMKVYVDSDKTASIKGYLKKNNTHNFYNTSTPTEDTTPIFSFDVGEEMSLDQTNTTFVQEFEWSDENYPNSTNPNLDGQAVLVLATKSNDMVSYSFVNLETLVDTYKTKNTTTLSLDITDNEISGNVNISTEDGNAIEIKDDGLYVPTVAEAKVSAEANNIISSKQDGLYATETITEIQLNNTPLTVTDKKVNIDLSDYVNVQSDWDETDTTKASYIANKPNLSNVDVMADDGVTVEETRLAYNGDNLAYQREIVDLQDKIDILNGDATVEGSVSKKIADANHLTKEIVDTLPDIADAKENVIYMIKDTASTAEDVYKEYALINGTIECIGSTSVDLSNYSTTDEVKDLIEDELYIENTISAHYELADSTTTTDALEVVADGTTLVDGQIELSNVTPIADTVNVGDYVVFVNEVTTIDTKYAEKSNVYSKTETDEKIAEAVTGGTVDLTAYVKTETLTEELAKYTNTVDSDEKYVLDEEIKVLSESDVLALLNMSDEELANLSNMFLDTEVRIDRGWSSSAIYTKLQENLDLAKTYTLEEIAKAAKASYKVVSSTSDVTETIYIYLIANTSNSYDMYILDTDTSSAVQIGTTEIDLSSFYTKTESEDLFVTKANLVANYATKQEVVDGYATKTELQDAIADVEVEISTDENNQLENRENGLFVDSETVTISKADYDALSIEEKSNGKTYFVPDDETTEDGTDLTQFAKVSDLEETNNKIEEINTDLGKKLSLSGGEMSGGIEMKGNTIGSVGDIFLNDKGAFLNALLTNINNNLAQLIKTTMVTASADISANSSVFMRVSPPETPSGYRDLFAFIQGGSGSIDTSQLLVGSGTTGCRVYNNLSQKQTVTIECRIVYIKNC